MFNRLCFVQITAFVEQGPEGVASFEVQTLMVRVCGGRGLVGVSLLASAGTAR
jgi:hypothetical protein